MQIELSGEIENVRERVGKGLVRADIIAQYVLRDARTLDDVANQVCVTRKTLLTQQVMPWLVTHGLTSRGGKNALVDHPIPLVNVFRPDVPGPTLTAAEALAGAPEHDGSRFKVSAILGEEQ